MTQIELKIYLKCMKKPIVAVLSKEEQVEEFYDKLENSNGVVRFYKIIFALNEFKYATINEK